MCRISTTCFSACWSPSCAGKVRQQDHWLSDFWPQRAPLHSAVAAQATAVREAPTAAEPAGHKTSRSPRSSLDRQRDLPLPDEPTTPAQQREGPFLDAATSSTDSADPSVESPAEVQPPAATVPEPQAASAPVTEPATDAAAAFTAEPAAALDTQPSQEPQQPSSPTSDAASSASPGVSGGDGFRFSAPGNVVVSMLIPRALSGWLLGPGGATAKVQFRVSRPSLWRVLCMPCSVPPLAS